MNFQAGEILYFDKPLYWTSFNLVAKVRSALCHKIGVRKLKVGQEVQVTPADLQRETWGYAYGHITGIEPFPTNQAEIMKRMKLEQFATFIPNGVAVYEVRVVLDADEEGIRWSRKKSRELEMKTGALCTIQVITNEKKVWQVLMNTATDTFDNILDK